MFTTKALGLVTVGIVLRAGCTVPVPLTENSAAAYEASLAASEEGFIVAWHDSADSPSTLHAQRVDAKGRPSGPQLQLTDGPHSAWEADIETVHDGFVVAWYETSRPAYDRALVGRFNLAGQRLWLRRVSAEGRNGRNPVVLTDASGIFVAWIERREEDADIWAQQLGLDGTDITAPVLVAKAGLTTWNLNADRDGEGKVWLVFDTSTGSRADEVFAARLAEGDAGLEVLTVERVTQDDGIESKYPDLAFGAGTLALTWFDQRDGNREVYLYTGSTNEIVKGLEAAHHRGLAFERGARRVTTTEGASIGAYVAWNGQTFGLTWSDHGGENYDIYFRSFSATGRALGRERRLTRNPTASLIPAIEPVDAGFALAWNEDVKEQRTSHLVGGRSDVVFSLVPER